MRRLLAQDLGAGVGVTEGQQSGRRVDVYAGAAVGHRGGRALGIDLDAQLWPAADDYVRLDRFPERVEVAAAEVTGWDEGEARRAALAMLRTLAHRWQAQNEVIALRVSPAEKAPPRVQYRVWRLLERARLGPTLAGK